MRVINSEKELLDLINVYIQGESDAIIVEGYDGVGKGRVLNILSEVLDVTPYRPDYNLWQNYDHRMIDRWKVSGFFWDVFSHFQLSSSRAPMLFDRGVISGAVYNHDISIAKNYKQLLRDSSVLHILVTCSKWDFIEFQKLRDPSINEFDLGYKWSECTRYTEDYLRCLDIAGVDYIVYDNKFNPDLAEDSKRFCLGCGHYSYGICRHPDKNYKVDPYTERCENSIDKETQDREETRYDSKM